MSYHHVTFLNNQEEVRALLAKIGVDDGAYPFLLPKRGISPYRIKSYTLPGGSTS